MSKFRLLLVALLLACPIAQAQFYTLHQQFLGIYFNPDLANNGFGIDIQNGVLFGTAFTYAAGGDDAFLTLLSTPATEAEPFVFNGDVFLTNNSGGTTEDVGGFRLEMVMSAGQPAFLMDIQSPYLDVRETPLFRFGYGDGDQLGPIAGKLWGISFTSMTGSISILDFIGGFFLIDTERVEVDGDTVLLVSSGIENSIGIAFYDPDSARYVTVIETENARDTLIFRGISSHSDMYGQVSHFQGNTLQTERAYVGAAAASQRPQAKSNFGDARLVTSEQLQRYRWLLGQTGETVDLPRVIR